MRKNTLLYVSLVFAILFSVFFTTPVHATNAVITKVEVIRQYEGASSTTTVWQNNGFVNRITYVDYGRSLGIRITTTGGTGTIYYHIWSDTGWSDYYGGTATTVTFYPSDSEADYTIHVDGNYLGGSTSNDFYVRWAYSDVTASKPSPNASAPFCVGQTVNWSVTASNLSQTPTYEYISVGYYLGTSANDYSKMFSDDSAGRLSYGSPSTENEDYTFVAEDAGSRYLNVMVDNEKDEPEENESNNKAYYGPFVVNPKPSPGFTATLTSIVPGTSVDFTNQTTGSATSYLWSFGDGGTSTSANPSHVYNTVGTYNVSLTATNGCGSVTTEKQSYIIVSYPPVFADFTSSSTIGYKPLQVTFTDISSGDPTSWQWDFGDSGSSSLQNPVHIYQNAGTYTVQLSVSGLGGTDTETKTNFITVTEPPPVADFRSNTQIGVKPLEISFTNLSTGVIDTYSWDFGDGVGTSTLQNPTYIFTDPGSYTVSLTVEGPGGTDTETKTEFIVVNEVAPQADFSADLTYGVEPLTVSFSNLSAGVIDSYSWDFGDGVGTSMSTSPSYTYTQQGSYTVQLRVSGPGGTDTETKTNYVTVAPNVKPTISNVEVTNIRDTSFSISWLTDLNAPGNVFYGKSFPPETSLDDDRGSEYVGETHYVTVSGLDPSTLYYFYVTSGSDVEDNGGSYYLVTTGPTLAIPASDTAFGRVYQADGSTFATGSIVYINLKDNNTLGTTGISAKMSSLVDENGYWYYNLGNARNGDTNSYFLYSTSGDSIDLSAQGGSLGQARLIVDTGLDAPAENLVLGTCNAPADFGKTYPSNEETDITTNLTLSWESSSGATQYDYCYDTSNDNDCLEWINVGDETNTTLSDLDADTVYYWQVRAKNESGTIYADGSPTAFWSFTTQPAAPVCHQLTLAKSGLGAIPSASPANSPNCPIGQFAAGASIDLTAIPASGYHVGSWSGTSNDNSTATSNNLSMPANPHTVTVFYEQDAPSGDTDYVFIPLIMRGTP